MLRKNKVSWIATGENHIDLHRAVEIMSEAFGVKRLIIVGGGSINGGFLEAGLIDEISLLLAPGIDGRKGTSALFDIKHKSGSTPYHLKLDSVEKCTEDTIWIHYKTIK